MAETLQRTRDCPAVEAHPDLDYTKAASMVLMDGLMQRVSTAEDEFDELPLDKAGRLIASLSRNATYDKRVRQEMKRKAELAFEQMETELLEKVKQYPDLAAQLRDVLARARGEGGGGWRVLTSTTCWTGWMTKVTAPRWRIWSSSGAFFSNTLSGRAASRTSVRGFKRSMRRGRP